MKTTIVITDIIGKKLFEKLITDVDNSKEVGNLLQLKDGKLTSGIYIIKICNGDETFNQKLFIE